MREPLTDKQQAVADFLLAYHLEHHCPPTVREIGERFGIFPNGVMRHLDALAKKGWVVEGAGGMARRYRHADVITTATVEALLPTA